MIQKNYTEADEFLVICVNPSPEKARNTSFRFQMPYEEFKIHQVKAPEMEVEVTDFDELLPSKLTNNGEEAPIYFSEVTVHTSQEPGELLQIFKVKSTSSLGLHTYPTNYVPVSEKNDTIQMDNIEIKYLGQTQDESACMFEYTDTQNDIK